MLGFAARRAIALVVMTVALAMPSSAGAVSQYDQYEGCWSTRRDNSGWGCNIQVSSLTTYKGWAHVAGQHCGGGMNTGYDYVAPAPHPAWQWTASGWRQSSLARGTQVYVWPYAVNWSWVWTQRTGWLAMQDNLLVINPDCGPPRPTYYR